MSDGLKTEGSGFSMCECCHFAFRIQDVGCLA